MLTAGDDELIVGNDELNVGGGSVVSHIAYRIIRMMPKEVNFT